MVEGWKGSYILSGSSLCIIFSCKSKAQLRGLTILDIKISSGSQSRKLFILHVAYNPRNQSGFLAAEAYDWLSRAESADRVDKEKR